MRDTFYPRDRTLRETAKDVTPERGYTQAERAVVKGVLVGLNAACVLGFFPTIFVALIILAIFIS